MRQLIACTACQRPHRADEAACPFCGVRAAKRPGREWVRKLKVGGLLAFTAVATAACYGSPPSPGTGPRPLPRSTTSAAPPPAKKVPASAGSASLYVTPKGGKEAGRTIALGDATLEGAKLTVTAANGAGDRLVLEVEATDAKAYEKEGQVYKAIDLATAKGFKLAWGAAGSKDPAKGLDVALGANAVKGTLQLDAVSATAISGTLLCEVDGTTVTLYFHAAR